MPSSTLAGIISAFGTVLTAVGLVITAIAGLIRSRRVERKVDDVHTMVNQQRTDAANYNRALVNALTSAGVAVPVDQSASPAVVAPVCWHGYTTRLRADGVVVHVGTGGICEGVGIHERTSGS